MAKKQLKGRGQRAEGRGRRAESGGPVRTEVHPGGPCPNGTCGIDPDSTCGC